MEDQLRYTIGSKISRPFFLQSESNQNHRDTFRHVFPRFASATFCIFSRATLIGSLYSLCSLQLVQFANDAANNKAIFTYFLGRGGA